MKRCAAGPALALVLIVGCSGTSSSSYRTSTAASVPYRGVVRISATAAPAGAQQVGVVEVSSVEELERAVAEFRTRVAEMGGDLGVIDRYSTSFEMVTSSRQETYSCGTQRSPHSGDHMRRARRM